MSLDMLDKFNREILACLEENGRASYTEIGKIVGLTTPAVAQRIRQMESEGIIKGYSVQIDHQYLGVDLRALITLRFKFDQTRTFKKYLADFPEIKACYRVTGEDCLILLVHLKNNRHLLDFIDRLYPYGITKTNIILEEFSAGQHRKS